MEPVEPRLAPPDPTETDPAKLLPYIAQAAYRCWLELSELNRAASDGNNHLEEVCADLSGIDEKLFEMIAEGEPKKEAA